MSEPGGRLRFVFRLATICVIGLVAWVYAAPRYLIEVTPERELEDPADVVIVLGSPARADGSITTRVRWRVDRGLQVLARYPQARIIFTGGAAHNEHVEARVMAVHARAQGTPVERIIEEGKSQTTKGNARLCVELMRARNWKRAVIVTSRYHTGRAGDLFRRIAPDLEFLLVPAERSADLKIREHLGWFVYEHVARFAQMWVR